MYKKLTQLISSLLFPLVIVSIWAYLVFKNYSPGVFLTGWDNLHPEFNLILNLERSFYGVWQEYQGLGLLGGMAHAADLPRQILLLIIGIFINSQDTRYFWSFLMLLIGPLGLFRLVSILFKDRSAIEKRFAGLVGGVFYLLNLATVQYFYVPYESFVAFYGFLPWLLYFASKYLSDQKRGDLFKFCIISLLSTSAFYVQTLFIVYILFLLVIIFETILQNKLLGLIRSIKLLFVTFAISAFWLLPALYFSVSSASNTTLSKINTIATPETQIMNSVRGDFLSLIQLKGYWFDYFDFTNSKYELLFSDWISHLDQANITYGSYFVFVCICIGLIYSLISKKISFKLILPVMFFVSWFMLSTNNPPFGIFYTFLSEKLPLFAEIFRNSFTKWSVAMALIYSLSLSSFIVFLFRPPKIIKHLLVPLFAVTILIVAALLVLPVFDGKLIYQRTKQSVPNEYFELFRYFEGLPSEGRVALFPVHSFWGWEYHNWRYGGSGFVWYGIKQPVLSRTFDVWSPFNETFYNQIVYSLQIGDKDLFESVLKKYNVSYLLMDDNMVSPGDNQEFLNKATFKDIVETSEKIKKVKQINNLSVYKTNLLKSDSFIAPLNSYSKVNADTVFSSLDLIYQEIGDYVLDSSLKNVNFVAIDGRNGINIQEQNGKRYLVNKDNNYFYLLDSTFILNEVFSSDQGYETGKNCDLLNRGSVEKKRLDLGGNLYIASGGGVECDYFYYPTISRNNTYLLRIRGENIEGRGLKFYVQNSENNHIVMEELLPGGVFDRTYLLLPHQPLKRSDSKEIPGYTVGVETRSFGKVTSKNIVSGIEFVSINLREVNNGFSEKRIIKSGNLEVLNTAKYGTWLYKVNTKGNGLISLSQGFDKGWIALKRSGDNLSFQKLTHLKLNSWANGFEIESGETNEVYILYWPQILEWLGMVMIPVVLFKALVSKKH